MAGQINDVGVQLANIAGMQDRTAKTLEALLAKQTDNFKHSQFAFEKEKAVTDLWVSKPVDLSLFTRGLFHWSIDVNGGLFNSLVTEPEFTSIDGTVDGLTGLGTGTIHLIEFTTQAIGPDWMIWPRAHLEFYTRDGWQKFAWFRFMGQFYSDVEAQTINRFEYQCEILSGLELCRIVFDNRAATINNFLTFDNILARGHCIARP